MPQRKKTDSDHYKDMRLPTPPPNKSKIRELQNMSSVKISLLYQTFPRNLGRWLGAAGVFKFTSTKTPCFGFCILILGSTEGTPQVRR